MERVKQVLAAFGRQINTAFVERLDLDIRQRVAAVGRRVNTLCQGEDGMQHQLAVFHADHNFVLPHGSLRQPLLILKPTHGTGSPKQWRPCTLAMAAGLTDHVWTLREVLLFRCPPWPQPHVGYGISKDMIVRPGQTLARAIGSTGLKEVEKTHFEGS